MTAAPEPAVHSEVDELRAAVRRLERRVERERAARQEAERIAEAGTRRLFELNAELDARVAQRTVELAEANREVHEASLAKTRLLAAISHEAFTPIHQAQGSIELAGAVDRDPWVTEQLDRARGALTSIERLFRNLLVVAEADSRGLATTVAPVDVRALLDDVVGHWRPLALRQRSLLVADVRACAGLTVTTDALRLRHALDELLHNAVRYTAGGIVRLTAALAVTPGPELEAEEDTDLADADDGGPRPATDRAELAITVSDEGPGLPPELATRLFEPFAGERDAAGTGLGLGLAAAARIASSLGGRLERVPGPVGESFRLALPR